jgi:hypothetical protein
VQLVLVDDKGGPDYDHLVPRAWLAAKDDLAEVRDMLRRVHRLMSDRQAAIATVIRATAGLCRDPAALLAGAGAAGLRVVPETPAPGEVA